MNTATHFRLWLLRSVLALVERATPVSGSLDDLLARHPVLQGYIPAYPVCCQSCYRVSARTAVECLVGRCRGMCRNSQDRVECRHGIETPVEAKHKFVEVSL